MDRFARRPSPAMIVACVALVMALVGTSIAATKIGKNSVGAKEFDKVFLRTSSVLVDGQGSQHGDATASCLKGEQLLAGGATFAGATADEFADVSLSFPNGANGWTGGGYVDGSETQDFPLVVTAICLVK